MRRFVDQYPEFRKLSGNVSKHVALVHEISRLVEMNALLDVSLLEQQLVCSDNRTEHLKSLLDRVRSPTIPKFEKLRLVLLYALHYENDPYLPNLKDELRKSGIDDSQVEIVDALLSHAGSSSRGSELFQKKDLLQIARNVVQRGFKSAPNAYAQHVPFLATLVESLIKGRVKETQYSFIPNTTATYQAMGRFSGASSSTDHPSEIIVFVVGGATFEEACTLHQLAAQHNIRIVLGGTTIHNSKTFLADVAQLNKSAHQPRRPGLTSWDANEAQRSDSCSIPIDLSGQEMVPINAFSSKPVLSTREAELALKQEFLRQKW
ncbi:vacuolar protein sorting-associated protein 45-like [Condylostylus longicornis]|uniref:vacuolar protein sorting-associated protein 45-like n=1 Tax=Condylostylus longicornis TaxID=2530218 RepID=UPI00244DB5C5|nr:vacuolar protein sorting-associated protein 45-like [Condylostylus longicornis]